MVLCVIVLNCKIWFVRLLEMEANKRLKELNTQKKTNKKPLKNKIFPPVRQTLTSYKRILKANPLLQYKEKGIDIDEYIAQKSLGNSLNVDSKIHTMLDMKSNIKVPEQVKKRHLAGTQLLNLPKSKNINLRTVRNPIICENQPYNKKSLNNGNSKTSCFKGSTNNQPIEANNANYNSLRRDFLSLSRSLSSGQIETVNCDPIRKKNMIKLNHSKSQEHVCVSTSKGFDEFSPIMEAKRENGNFCIKTPSVYNRQSIYCTPQSNRRTTLFQASTPAPVNMQILQERLNKWLKSRGKPPASFFHLRVFESEKLKKEPPITSIAADENKENIEVIQDRSESFENLGILNPEIHNNVGVTKDATNDESVAKNAKEAMIELLKLIDENYPRDQCLGWLELIREKYSKIEDEPLYWECRAAIEQSVGNVLNAVEFYKTAIIQGAEVADIDKSLDQLLKKFSLLNISVKKSDQNHKHDETERIITEARNVFKSSIIQFAVRERNIKTKNVNEASEEQHILKKMVAIPVRRSTRVSRSGYTNTSGVKLCTSLRQIYFSEDEISFEKNKALC